MMLGRRGKKVSRRWSEGALLRPGSSKNRVGEQPRGEARHARLRRSKLWRRAGPCRGESGREAGRGFDW